MYALNEKDFNYISSKIYEYAKINLTEKKKPLIISRLSKRIRALKLSGFKEYIQFLENDETGIEFQSMVDSLSTNYSLFFREPHHLEFLKEKILPVMGNNELKIWSAASSTGQEIYSILMTIKEFEEANGKSITYNLLASDISSSVLTHASKGLYQMEEINDLDLKLKKKYFLKGNGANSDTVKLKNNLIKEVKFFKLNLNDRDYRIPLMDIIFLRNVIIYFDAKTKIELINRLHSYLKPNGYLILGHSESLSNISDKFKLVGKTIYKRIT